MNAVLMFFMCHSDKSVKFLDSTVAEDETWVFYHTPESKQQSINWHHTHSPKKKEIKNQPQPRKIWQLSSETERGFLCLILCLMGPP
jgi:hypothetical protein